MRDRINYASRYCEIVDFIYEYLKNHNNFLDRKTLTRWINQHYQMRHANQIINKLIEVDVIKSSPGFSLQNTFINISPSMIEYQEKKRKR